MKHNLTADNIQQNYSQLIHGRSFFELGLSVSPTCTDCHTSHDVLPGKDPNSTVNSNNITKTCRVCHTRNKVIHKKIFKIDVCNKPDEEIPSCVQCHKPHTHLLKNNDLKPKNQQCFKCHGTRSYSYFSKDLDITVEKRMSPYQFIDSTEFYISNHKNFSCTTCHSADYEIFPHRDSLLIEQKLTCLDCHENDTHTAKYHFEIANEGFKKSVHYLNYKSQFNCNSCHDIHTYKFQEETPENIKNKIEYDNNICYKCHANPNYLNFYDNNLNPNFSDVHTWLPNQELHFKSVRCIDCHTNQRNNPDSLVVSHEILPKEKALRNCIECHSKNSVLLQSLYKVPESEINGRVKLSSVIKNSYIIGAHNNILLQKISIFVFVLMMLGFIIHRILFVITKKNN